MQITFLGTGAGVPSRSRNVSAMVLRLDGQSEAWLFDCGEGTQHQLLRSSIRTSQIRRIFLTHLHGDHLFGLPGLLATCGLSGDSRGIDLYGPEGLEEFVETALRLSHSHLPYPLSVHTLRSGVVFSNDLAVVTCLPLSHRIPTYGYRIQERDQPGRFDAEHARRLGVPDGPLFGALKRGENVVLSDGKVVEGNGLIGPPRPGRVVALCTDTIYCREGVELARDADLLVHEATFAGGDKELALRSQHSTAPMAGRTATEAGAALLALTHISPRYSGGDAAEALALLNEAREIFPATILAEDFMTIDLPRRASGSSPVAEQIAIS